MKQVILVILLFHSLSLAAAIPDKDKVYNDLIKKYGEIKSVSVIYDYLSFSNISIKAKKGNKYIMKEKDFEIISDGKTVWNYHPNRKAVIISNFEEKSGGLVYIFFNIIPNLQPMKLKTELSSNKGKLYVLELHNKSFMKEERKQVLSINLYIDTALKKIEAIEVVSSDDTDQVYHTKFNIKKIEINKSIPDSIFTFKVSKGVEEIDTR